MNKKLEIIAHFDEHLLAIRNEKQNTVKRVAFHHQIQFQKREESTRFRVPPLCLTLGQILSHTFSSMLVSWLSEEKKKNRKPDVQYLLFL